MARPIREQNKGTNWASHPIIGAAIGFKSDIEVRLGEQNIAVESKCRNEQFKRIYQWLTGADALVLKADREVPLIVLDLGRFTSLLSQIPHSQTETIASKPSQDPVNQ